MFSFLRLASGLDAATVLDGVVIVEPLGQFHDSNESLSFAAHSKSPGRYRSPGAGSDLTPDMQATTGAERIHFQQNGRVYDSKSYCRTRAWKVV